VNDAVEFSGIDEKIRGIHQAEHLTAFVKRSLVIGPPKGVIAEMQAEIVEC